MIYPVIFWFKIFQDELMSHFKIILVPWLMVNWTMSRSCSCQEKADKTVLKYWSFGLRLLNIKCANMAIYEDVQIWPNCFSAKPSPGDGVKAAFWCHFCKYGHLYKIDGPIEIVLHQAHQLGLYLEKAVSWVSSLRGWHSANSAWRKDIRVRQWEWGATTCEIRYNSCDYMWALCQFVWALWQFVWASWHYIWALQ